MDREMETTTTRECIGGYYTNPLVLSLITTCTTSFGKEEGVSELTCLFCGG